MTRRSTRSLRPLLLATCLLAVAGGAGAQKLYKWVDADGRVTYQDEPPPEGREFSVRELGRGEQPGLEGANGSGAQGPSVTLYVVKRCDACDLVRVHLTRRAILFTERDVESNAESQRELKAVAGRLEVPTLVIGDRVVRGYSRAALEDALGAAGFPPGADRLEGPAALASDATPAAPDLPAREQTREPALLPQDEPFTDGTLTPIRE